MKKFLSRIVCIFCISFFTATGYAADSVIDLPETFFDDIDNAVVNKNDELLDGTYSTDDGANMDEELSADITKNEITDAATDENMLKIGNPDDDIAHSAISVSAATNIALGKPVTYNKEQPSEGHLAVHVNDGRRDTRWSAEGPSYVVIELGQEYFLGYTLLFPSTDGGREYKYTISVSNKLDSGYEVIVDRTDNSTCAPVIYDDMNGAAGRYVKLDVIGGAEWVSIYEFEIYQFDAEVNWALSGTVQEYSSEQNEPNAVNLAKYLIDDNDATRWSAHGYPNYVVIDLGEPRVITRTKVVPIENRAYKYKISASLNGYDYYDIVNQTGSAPSMEATISSVKVRFVKFTVTGYSGGEWISINELCLYGPQSKNISPLSNVRLEVNSKGATVTANVAALNGGTVTLIAVVFDGDKMVEMKEKCIEYSRVGDTISGSVTFDSDMSGKTAEAFIWDTDETMLSCCETETLKLRCKNHIR